MSRRTKKQELLDRAAEGLVRSMEKEAVDPNLIVQLLAVLREAEKPRLSEIEETLKAFEERFARHEETLQSHHNMLGLRKAYERRPKEFPGTIGEVLRRGTPRPETNEKTG